MSAERPYAREGIEMRTRPAAVVRKAPQRALITLQVLHEACGHEMQVRGDRITIADQVEYRVVGWDAESACLMVDLVQDDRTGSEAP